MCKNSVKKSPIVITYFFDCGKYKTPEMLDMFILENDGILKFISDYCKDKKLCGEAVNRYTSAIYFFSERYKIQKMGGEAIGSSIQNGGTSKFWSCGISRFWTQRIRQMKLRKILNYIKSSCITLCANNIFYLYLISFLITPIYILFTKRIDTFWSGGISSTF